MKTGLRVKKVPIDDRQLQLKWKEWEKGSTVSPFLYYEYTRFIYRYYRYHSVGYIPAIYCAIDEAGDILMILPLKKRLFGGHFLLNDKQGCGAAGCICDPKMDNAAKEEYLDAILYKIKDIKLRRVSAGSPLHDYAVKAGDKYKEQAATVCVGIPVPADFDTHFASLSSSNRQNIRTAYNRLNRDGKSYAIKVFDNVESLGAVERGQIMDIYMKRLFSKYKQRGAVKTAIKRFVYEHIKHDTHSLFSLANTFHAILYIDGEAAAFLSGFTDHGRSTIVVPRLAVDIDYKFYSPGYILLCETLKHLSADGTIRLLDLSRGDEKYKLDLGGKKYYTHSFVRG